MRCSLHNTPINAHHMNKHLKPCLAQHYKVPLAEDATAFDTGLCCRCLKDWSQEARWLANGQAGSRYRPLTKGLLYIDFKTRRSWTHINSHFCSCKEKQLSTWYHRRLKADCNHMRWFNPLITSRRHTVNDCWLIVVTPFLSYGPAIKEREARRPVSRTRGSAAAATQPPPAPQPLRLDWQRETQPCSRRRSCRCRCTFN